VDFCFYSVQAELGNIGGWDYSSSLIAMIGTIVTGNADGL
jgi:hypothetical protein